MYISGVKLMCPLRDGVDGVLCDGVAAGVGGFVDGEEPLHGEARLDDDAGALREADGVGVVFDGVEEAARLRGRRGCVRGRRSGRGRGKASREGRRGRSHRGCWAGEVVALADGEVVGVVRGGDFDGSGAELGFGPVVGEDGDFAGWIAVVSVSGTRTFLPMRRCSARRWGLRLRRCRPAWSRGGWWRW